MADQSIILAQILGALQKLETNQAVIAATIEGLQARIDTSSSVSKLQSQQPPRAVESPSVDPKELPTNGLSTSPPARASIDLGSPSAPAATTRRASITSRIILTTYPGQSGIDPVPLHWGSPDPQIRGPVIVSRHQKTIRRRNALGAHGGSYSIYNALAVASHHLDLEHKPDFTNTEPLHSS